MYKHNLHQRYSDLFENQNDSRLNRLVEDLEATYHAPMPPQLPTWQLIQARYRHLNSLKAVSTSHFSSRFKLVQWLSLSTRSLAIIAALLAALVVTGTVYAVIAPFLGSVLSSRPATSYMVQHKLFSPIQQSRTVAGVTINIDSAYADANELIIASTLVSNDKHTILANENSAPDRKQISLLHIVVSTKDGTVLGDSHSGKLIVGGSASQNTDKYREAEAFYVDTDRITGNPQQLDIHLKMEIGTGAAFRTPHVLGSATFDFSVPFHSGGLIKLGQQQTTEGETITLQKAIITPSDVRIFVSGLQPWGKANLFATVSVSQDPKSYDALSGSPQGDGSFLFTFPHRLYGKHGAWTITITERENHLFGKIRTWTFHFNVP
ncbi:DUF4179 domain-containing protein [Ktedonosporobacter rubrisoli]|uniref:DUF4179 domain-containing protein n=1 Tax=Ktedonosporobacter rubrisoli TaxID=2509675 RepID=A0A4V0YY86_KTERU|nr:DUF4179 domain-containing protein [Ktedonosporobacter rubrisoli]QBD75351.1 DUF4179 domain-containing protein [Ktedonosporobacter rubrisoli]